MTKTLFPIWLAYTAVLGFVYAHVPPCPDLAGFDYAGWVVSQGGTPYVDVIEQNWPGAIWMHTVSTLMFGNHLWSFRVLDYGLMCVGALALFALLRQGGRPSSAWIVVPLYQAMYVVTDLWVAGQRDIVAIHLLLPSIWAYVVRWKGGGRILAIPLGASTALCTLIRPTYLLFPVLVWVSDLLLARHNRRTFRVILADMTVAGLAAVAALGIIALSSVQSGALTGWYDAGVLFNAQLYSRTTSSLEVTRMILSELRVSWHWYAVFSLAGAALWWKRGERNVFAMVMALFILGLTSTYVQGKGFGYHLGAWMPVMAAFSAELIAAAVEELRKPWSRPRHARLAAALLVCAIALLGSGKKMYGSLKPQVNYVLRRIDYATMAAQLSPGIDGMSIRDIIDAADFARTNALQGETVLVWNRAVVINFLAERKLPTPLATIGVLELLRPPFHRAEAWLSDFERGLRENPPSVIFAPSSSEKDHHRLFLDPDAPRATLALRSALTGQYRKVASFGTLEAYLRGPVTP